MPTLDQLLKYKRNMPLARRLLKRGEYEESLGVSCPGMVKYKSTPEIAEAVAKQALKKVLTKRKKASEIVPQLYKVLKSLPLKIRVHRPGTGSFIHPMRDGVCKWHHIAIRDEFILEELRHQLQQRHYTTGVGKRQSLNYLLVKTY